MKLKVLSGLPTHEWKEMHRIICLDLNEQQSRIGLDEKNNVLFYDWLDQILDERLGERFWGKAEGRALEFPKDRPTIWRILRLVASCSLGAMRAAAESPRKATSVKNDVRPRKKAPQGLLHDSQPREFAHLAIGKSRAETTGPFIHPTRRNLRVAGESPGGTKDIRLNKRPRTDLNSLDRSFKLSSTTNDEKNISPMKSSASAPHPSSQFPHLFITHITSPNTPGPRKHHLIDVTEPTSFSTFLENVCARAEDEMGTDQHITRVQIEIAGRDVDISVEDAEGEWDWSLVMGILLYSGIPVGSSTYVRCLAM